MRFVRRRPFKSVAELDAETLECFRICWHRELAVAAALHYCTEHELSAPQWLIVARSGWPRGLVLSLETPL